MTSFKKHLISGALLAGALAVPALGLADDATTTTAMATPVATPTPLAWYQKVTVGGYLDAYYQVNFNNPSSIGSPSDRVFDDTDNQFSFGGGELTLKQNDASSGTGYYLDLLMGNMASIYNNSAAVNGGIYNNIWGNTSYHYGFEDGALADPQDFLQLGQAYVTQSWGNATLTLGKFGTPIGYEVTYAPSDANFSRGLLFSNEPFFNTGAELSYTLPAGFTIMGFTDDGNSTDNATTLGKDYGAQLAYAGVKNLSLTGTWYLQQGLTLTMPTAYAFDEDGGTLTLLDDTEWGDFVASYQATGSLSFAGEYLFKEFSLLGDGTYDQGVGTYGFPNINPIQQGYALYATYSPFNNFSISPRFEQWYNPEFGSAVYADTFGAFLDSNGPWYSPTVTNEYTLTLKYQMGPLAHMLEYRADASDEEFYTTGNKTSTPSFYNNVQQTLTYAAEYSF